MIWKKSLFKKMFKFIFLFLISIFFIFSLIDFSIHSARMLSSNHINIFDILAYYYHNFIFQFNLFLSLSFMLGMIKVIYHMNIKNELLALQTAGISLFKIAKPIFFIAFLLFLVSILNMQFLLPKSYIAIENFKNTHTRKKTKKKVSPFSILLNDSSKLIYLKYDENKKILFDVFLIKSLDDIWHMKSLDISFNKANGKYVDHFIRNEEKKLEKKESYKTYYFPSIEISKISSRLNPVEYRTIFSLFNQKIKNKYISKKEKYEVISNLQYKIVISMLPFLLVIAIFPYLVKFSRKKYFFSITAFSVFSFIGFYTILDSCVILSENNMGSSSMGSSLIILVPFFILLFIFSLKFFKMKTSF